MRFVCEREEAVLHREYSQKGESVCGQPRLHGPSPRVDGKRRKTAFTVSYGYMTAVAVSNGYYGDDQLRSV